MKRSLIIFGSILLLATALWAAQGDLFSVRNQSGTDVFTIDNSGNVNCTGTITVTSTLRVEGYTSFRDVFISPAADTVGSCSAAVAGDSLALTDTYGTGVFTQPDVARNLIISAGNGRDTGTITVSGYSLQGTAISEAFVFSGETTSATDTGNVAFAWITTITGNSTFFANVQAADTWDFGYGNKFGLSGNPADTISVFYVDGHIADTGISDPTNTRADNQTLNTTYYTWTPATAADGENDYYLYYKGFNLNNR